MKDEERIWRLLEELIESQKETDRRMKETDRRMGKFVNGWGSFIEGLAAPSIPKVFEKFGIKVFGTSLDQVRHKDGETMEVDILAVGRRDSGRKVTIVVEMKSRLRAEDVKEFTERLGEFPRFFDEYRDTDIIGVVGGIRIDEGVAEFAERRGLCIIAPSEDVMILLNKEGFIPKVWV
jgi:hypothetical protein